MQKILIIAARELRVLLQDIGIWINLIVIPIAISFAVGVANGALVSGPPPVPNIPMDVIDNDSSETSAAFIADLKAANPNLRLCPLENTDDYDCGLEGATLDEALANERLEAQRTLALLIIPQGFADGLTAGEASLIYRSNEDASAPSYIRQALEATVQRWGAAQVAANVGTDIFAAFPPTSDEDSETVRRELREDAQALVETDLVRIDFQQSSGEVTQQGDGFGQSFPGIASMYVMFGVLPLMNAFFSERKNWTFQRMMTMPVTRGQILGGKLLTYFTLGMVQYIVLFGVGFLVGVRYGNDPLALILLMVSYTACITALALTLMTVIRSEAQANGLSSFIALTLAPLGGAWWPLEVVSPAMQTVGHISPIAWVMDGYRSLIFYSGNLSTVIVPIAVLLGAAAILFLIGVARFRYD
jgi:ABC-2 type transport system permease protein